ncbi:MAG: hypothetical protein RIT41_1076 [Bacteroidota bacterium]|jgi:hypothetical protein
MQKYLLLLLTIIIVHTSSAQKKERKGEFYISWGYNKEYYTLSNVTINQPALKNNFTFKNTLLVDNPGWDSGIFNKALSIPQYNYRFGYFFDKNKDLAFEINFDHTKALFKDNQLIRMTGTYNGAKVDSSFIFTKSGQGTAENYYYLNNGANFLLFNIVKRKRFKNLSNDIIAIDGLAKAGIGPLIPHVENKLFGQKNDKGFQFGGWNTGLEYALRSTFYKKLYLEFAGKLDYAYYYNLDVYKGNAKQGFGTMEFILSLGYTLPMGPKINSTK